MEQHLQRSSARMKRIALIAIALACVACSRSSPTRRVARSASDVQTIDNTPPAPAAITPPPVLTDEGPPPKAPGNVATSDAPPPPTPQDEAVRASLPFAPAIALDPVDGSKISIRATTPTAEYKGHIFYFSSEANKRTFLASPDQYLKGAFKFS
jgi:YHS domain-containing protein